MRHQKLKFTAVVSAILTCVMGGCVSSPALVSNTPVYQNELFQSKTPFWREFQAEAPEVCESARRSMMSQGFVIWTKEPLAINGRKFYQPEHATHVELAINITCVPSGENSKSAIAYVSAWQDHFNIKKIPGAASLGVGIIGSISLPLSVQEDALVKVGVDTISDPVFYERFYALLLSGLEQRLGR